jgi:hypothetical protein
MIPLGFPVFTGDSGDFGRQIGLFCQATCTDQGSRARSASASNAGRMTSLARP